MPTVFRDKFNAKQMREVRQIVRDRHTELVEAWNDHFGRQE
jgi:hypothetical protein